MRFVKDTTWESVFAGWKEREASNPGWIDCATRIKGWPDWESWRRFSASLIKADQRDWQVFQFEDPAKEVGEMLVGPYSGWQKKVFNKNKTTFSEFLDITDNFDFYSQHEGVFAIMKGLPFETELIGLIREDNGKIVCLDGHHRAVAISLAKKLGREIDYSNVKMKIALAHLRREEIDLFDQMLSRGSAKKD